MQSIKNGIRIDSSAVFHSLLCSICSALLLGIITTVFPIATTDFHYIAVLVVAFYYFIFYVLFANPIQFKLNQNPKRYNFQYMIIYMIGAFIGAATAIIVMFRSNPFITMNFYILVILAAVIFWLIDSNLLQKGTLKMDETYK